MAGCGGNNVPILFSWSQVDQTSAARRFAPASRQGLASGRVGRPTASAESRAGEPKQYPALNAYSQGVRRMGLAASKRPVVLIVEDEFLLRMDAVDMIAAAGFEVVEAANADEAIEILESRPRHHRGFHRYPDAGLDGRVEARPGGQGPLAADQDCRNLRPRPCGGNGSARRRTVSAEALQSECRLQACCGS